MPRQFFGSTESLANAAPLKLNFACLDVSLIKIFIFLALIKILQVDRIGVFYCCVKKFITKTANKQQVNSLRAGLIYVRSLISSLSWN
jgi:hypothetical protein